ncbi:MAG: DUF3575 domain-containing protein [Bacteroidetes bacterium]|nr:MAG: DUF3575 domain-containing protein [Bacteroidota bacterium]
MKRFLLFSLAILSFGTTSAQSEDHSKNNVIRWNMTPTLISGTGSWVFGYERVLSHSRSISTNIGRIQFPLISSFIKGDLAYKSTSKNNGLSFSADYRFYLTSRNKRSAPDGVYAAPFLLYYNFDLEHQFGYPTNQGVEYVGIGTDINAITAGVELGYQFVFDERWTVDLIFIGPCFGLYTVNAGIEGDLPNNITESEAWSTARDFLLNSYPGVVDHFENGTFSKSGRSKSWGFNFRYVLQVGYRF